MELVEVVGLKRFSVEGALSRGFSRVYVKGLLKFKLNVFSCTRNAPKTPREKKNDLLKVKTNHTQVLLIFLRNKGKLENISVIHFHPGDPQPNTLHCSFRELLE